MLVLICLLIISVKDNGIGILEEKHKIIFERYRQVNSTLLQKSEGSGIGLALTKSLVELHNGTIEVKSEIGVGSEFIVKLPNVIYKTEETQISCLYDKDNIDRIINKLNVEFSDIYI
jgi:signal transduction histidine kinase